MACEPNSIIERLKELEARASSGPWRAVKNGVHSAHKAICGRGFCDDHVDNHICDTVLCDQADAELIAEMRNNLKLLLTAIKEADCVLPSVGSLFGDGRDLQKALKALGYKYEEI